MGRSGLTKREAERLADELMTNLDQDGDGRISLDEFSDQYIEIVKQMRH